MQVRLFYLRNSQFQLDRHGEALVDAEASLALLFTSLTTMGIRAQIYLHLERSEAWLKRSLITSTAGADGRNTDVHNTDVHNTDGRDTDGRDTDERNTDGRDNVDGSDNLFNTPRTSQPPSQKYIPRPPPTQGDREALLACLRKYPHHPDTEAGRLAHQAQQIDWAKTHGLGALVTESTPYPLRPGTCPVCVGECFIRGFLGHKGRRDGSTCGGNRALHPHEQEWRSICSRILMQTHAATNVTVDDYGTTWEDVQGSEDGLYLTANSMIQKYDNGLPNEH